MPQKLSVSFTLGKASVPHGANLAHNNREFIARNIDASRTAENVTYIQQDVQDAYNQLFSEALKEYNAKQKQPCRRIQDYYQHISDSKREEAFYEAVVQYGDSKTAPCGSQNGELAKQMLGEYLKEFIQSNPKLYVFNAVLHMDEASPHLHINFIPFYEQSRTKGLRKGVSMKAALSEQGFQASSVKNNQLVAWEAREMFAMEQILNQHGFVREDKGAHYAHKTVEEYKSSKDEKKIISVLRTMFQVSDTDMTEASVRKLKTQLRQLENENQSLEKQKLSPYKAFFYSLPEKQAFVQSQLDALSIPYRETENGFEAQEYFVAEIRQIEREFKPARYGIREQLRNDIDRLLMQSDDWKTFLEKLQHEKCSIKTGKYLAIKPPYGEQYIRLKSLGTDYSEYALRNRLKAKKNYELDLQQKISTAPKKDTPEILVLRTMRFYTITFSKGALPMKKREQSKPFSWTNDSELDKLTALNQKINAGATMDSLRSDLAKQEQAVSEKEAALETIKKDLNAFRTLKEKIEIVFKGKSSSQFSREQALQTLQRYPNITQHNYTNIDTLIQTEQKKMEQTATELTAKRKLLQDASDTLAVAEKVMGGTYVQSLVGDERQRREAKYIPNGLKADK